MSFVFLCENFETSLREFSIQKHLSKLFLQRCQLGAKKKKLSSGEHRNVSGIVVSTVLNENTSLGEPDVMIAGPSNANSPRIENSILESLRASLKEEITSEIKILFSGNPKKTFDDLET